VELSVSSESLRSAKTTVFKPLATDGTIALYAADHKTVIKDIRTDPIVDAINTGIADSIGGTLAETLAEGGFDPGQVLTNPAAGVGGGITPFVMATPHQAPTGRQSSCRWRPRSPARSRLSRSKKYSSTTRSRKSSTIRAKR